MKFALDEIWPDSIRIPLLNRNTHYLILTGLTLLLMFSSSFQLPLVDRDEPRFAQATREMQEQHSLLIPYFNGAYRFDKPPYIYWNMMMFYGVFGIHEVTARLPSILHTLLLVLTTYEVGRFFFNPSVGFCGAFGLGTCAQILIHGHLAVADLPMIFYLTLTQGLLLHILMCQEDHRPDWTILFLFYLCQALGFLAKGPVVQAITVLTLLFYRFVFWRQPVPWSRLHLLLGIPVMVTIVGIWGVPALIKTHGLWWKVGIGQHVVARGMEAFNGRPYFAPYYLVSAFLSLCPWLALAGYSWQAVRLNWNATNAFLCSWVVGTYLLFTCYSTQLPHYVLPAFPAIFLLLAQVITLPTGAAPSWGRWFLLAVTTLYALLCLILGAADLFLLKVNTTLAAIFLCLLLLFAGLLGLLFCFLHEKWRFFPFAILMMVVGLNVLAISLRESSPVLPIAQIAHDLPSDCHCLARGFSEPSLVFYTNRHWDLDQSLPELQTAMKSSPSFLVVELVEERSLGQSIRWWLHHSKTSASSPSEAKPWTNSSSELAQLPPGDYKSEEVTGLNLARSSWVRLMVYYQLKRDSTPPPEPN